MSPEQKKDGESLAQAGEDDELGELSPGALRSGKPGGATGRPAADGQALAARHDRERRRAVRAESRLAEIELALRRAIGASNGGGIPVGELRAVLDSVDVRLAALEDELKAGESELTFLAEAQRIGRATFAAGSDDLARTLEETRRDLDDALRLDREGLPELARQKMEFEVELDRLQSLLAYRDNVCEGLAEELQNGTRVTAEVIGRLADLSRGRVASTRRPPTVDARVAALRRDLEAEQTRLQQMRRALEAARAEAKSAQQAAVETERSATERLNAVGRERLEREREHARLYAELEQSLSLARDGEAEARRRFQAGVAERHALQMRLEALGAENATLREQLELGASDREKALRADLESTAATLEETEAERVRLAERMSLLQAALAAKETADRRRDATKSVTDLQQKRRVLSLVHNRPTAAAGDGQAENESDAGAPAPGGETVRERETEIDRLSQRWRDLQDAYKDALSEFDDMRRKRDNLLLRLNPQSGTTPPAVPTAEGAPPIAVPPDLSIGAPPDLSIGTPTATRPACLVHLDEAGERIEAIRALTRDGAGIAFAWGRDPEVPPHVEPLLLLNLMAEDADPFARLTALAGAARSVSSFTYCARGERGFMVGPVEFFPAPFDPEVCAQLLLGRARVARRVLAVGDAIEALGALREILGRARCSTAVAFDGGQALELAPMVRPNFVLVDLSLPAGDALRVLRALRADPRGADIAFGAMWSRPLDADKFRADQASAVAESTLSTGDLSRAVGAWLASVDGDAARRR